MDEKLCPKMEHTLTLLGKKWVGLIVLSLLNGPKKFTEMENYISGISARLLTERLKLLVNEDIIRKNIYPDTTIRIEYELTDKGLDLSETYKSIGDWTEKWN